MVRSILTAPITLARRTDRIAIAAPGDFRHGGWSKIESRPVDALPYCLDIARMRAIYLTGLDPTEAQQAPFYYLYARRSARAIVSVPFEGLAQSARASPVLLFSPGRCGSTLLSQILFEARLPNISEPDFYTQLTSLVSASTFNPLRGVMVRAVHAMGSDLGEALGTPLVAKLRAECCRAPQLLIDDRENRTLFMTRRFDDWVRSTGRVFRNPPRKMIGKFLQSLACFAWLSRHTKVHLVRYDDLVTTPEIIAENLALFLGRAIPKGVASAALVRDSQEGTPLAQGTRSLNDRTARYVDHALTLWNSDKVRRLRDRLDVGGTAL